MRVRAYLAGYALRVAVGAEAGGGGRTRVRSRVEVPSAEEEEEEGIKTGWEEEGCDKLDRDSFIVRTFREAPEDLRPETSGEITTMVGQSLRCEKEGVAVGVGRLSRGDETLFVR